MRPLLDMVKLNLAVPRGEAGFWTVIKELDRVGRPWTANDVSRRTNVSRRLATRYLRKLRLAGFVEIVDQNKVGNGGGLPSENIFTLVKKPALAPRLAADGKELPESAKEQLWRAMKMIKMFGAADLVGACPDVPLSTARNYACALAAAGILAQNGHVFRLVRNLGNQAPKVLAAKLVFDPNAKVVVGHSVAREVSP
ncbi:hypothetical protein [Mesorhizobium sp. WSM3626]|uniref:hypothetical protein n=1 Tax=Mesorhizobium sp. WSM3626 TaxID=1040987 RepID=UPI000484479A|nr:hypothetical protein [Mesorhizobium sp. WSM3626]